MHFRELISQPVNFLVSSMFVLSTGLITTSVVLDNAGLPNPVTLFGASVMGMLFDYLYTA